MTSVLPAGFLACQRLKLIRCVCVRARACACVHLSVCPSVRPCDQRLELHVVADGNAREPLVLSVTLVTVRAGDGGVEGAEGGVEECCDPYATAGPPYQVLHCRGFPQPSPICLSTPLAPPPAFSTRTRVVCLALLAGFVFSTQQLTRLSPPQYPCAYAGGISARGPQACACGDKPACAGTGRRRNRGGWGRSSRTHLH